MWGAATLGKAKADVSSQARSSKAMIRVFKSETNGVSDCDVLRRSLRTTDCGAGCRSCSLKNDCNKCDDLAEPGRDTIERVHRDYTEQTGQYRESQTIRQISNPERVTLRCTCHLDSV